VAPASSTNPKEELKEDKNWVSILKNYRLMGDAHYENDAQNWHIIGAELFNSRFERRNLKHLRIFLKQPSPNWLDFSLRNITAFTKRIDYS